MRPFERDCTLRIENTGERLSIFRKVHSKPVLVQHAEPDKRPFIHPILAPDGVGEMTENEPGHHPWQHGLYVGLNDVNGVGFWTEGLKEKNKDSDGSFHPKQLAVKQEEDGSVHWKVTTEWRSPDGAAMLDEFQEWGFRAGLTEFVVDLMHTFRAQIDLTFGQYSYGGLFLRMPFRKENGGQVLSSEGAANQAAEAQRARWVAVEMPIPGRQQLTQPRCSIAILDHPSNPEHPIPWRVDNQLGIGPGRCIAGPWRLPQAEITTSRYRLLISSGGIKKQHIEQEWQHFKAE